MTDAADGVRIPITVNELDGHLKDWRSALPGGMDSRRRSIPTHTRLIATLRISGTASRPRWCWRPSGYPQRHARISSGFLLLRE